jgi:serine/threonine-protein kinase
MAADRHLLFGLLALQTGLIQQAQLVAAFHAWTGDKARPLADHLIALGHLSPAQRSVVEALTALHLQAHGDDVEKSLAALPAGRSTRKSLAGLSDPDIEATLGHVASAHSSTDDSPADADRTASYAVGTATSDGQRFRVLRPHARGGLGAVFVALDTELHREVALKEILDHHADDPVSRQRFVAEAEITGGLEHPGIVPVYGLGTYGSGRPYYAMRFIKGDSLKEAIQAFHEDAGSKSPSPPRGEGARRAGEGAGGTGGSRDLALRKLLRRFLDVCNAVDYAHSRGVIHRDIKPANIILGRHGETLVVDWGLAKAVGRADPSVGEQTIAPSSSGSSETLPGSALGTPAYMSPEQAAGDLDRLGPRSDVYALGATLYCLLTGEPPFDGDDVGETLRKVQLGEFPSPREVNPTLDRALEAICTKAMATKPADRYDSCRALAEDLERWAADEPVMAYPEPWTRTLVRWLTRHRTGVTGVAAAVLAGVVGLSAVVAVQTQANAQLSASLKRETNARLDLAAANARLSNEQAKVEARNRELADEQAKVQARFELAQKAIATFHTGVSEDFLLKQDQFKELRDRLLKSASDFYGKLGAMLGAETDTASRRALARANFELAELTAKVGRVEDALAAHRAVLARREALAADPAVEPEVRADVGRSLTAVASLLEAIGKGDEAEATYRRAESLLAGLVRSAPQAARAALADCRSRLGRRLAATGRTADALAVYRLARDDQGAAAAAPGAPAAARRDLADTIHRIGDLVWSTGTAPEAEDAYRSALAIRRKFVREDPAAESRSRLADSHIALGDLLFGTGRRDDGVAEVREGLGLHQALADENPAVAEYRSRLANTHHKLSAHTANQGRPEDAAAEMRAAMSLYRGLAAEYPTVIEYRRLLASGHYTLAHLLCYSGRPVEGEAEFREALAMQRRLVAEQPAVTKDRSFLSAILTNLGGVLRQAGRTAEAESGYREAMANARKLADEHPADSHLRRIIAFVGEGLGELLLETGRVGEAGDVFREAVGIRQRLADENPTVSAHRGDLAWCISRLARVQWHEGRTSEAVASLRKAIDIHERRGSATPTPTSRYSFACYHALLAGLAAERGSGLTASEGRVQADRAMAALRLSVDGGLRDPDDIRTNSDFKALRDRPDFQLLLMDLVMPADPFAYGG